METIKFLCFSLLCLMALSANAQYVDLGLPSGTKWKTYNESGLYTYNAAVSRFDKSLPSKAQWEELATECEWSWTRGSCKVTGPNGQSITLPAAGYRRCKDGQVSDDVNGVYNSPLYWSSTPFDPHDGWSYYIDATAAFPHVSWFGQCSQLSVRLVQEK